MGREPAPSAERPMRADARRNIEAILHAAVTCLARDPDASVADIAKTAGVGRVTLYGHFRTRADLIDAVLDRTIRHADTTLDAVDTTGDPTRALTRLVTASWQIVHDHRAVRQAAQRELPAERLRGSHDRIMRRLQTIIDRGRRSGAFRTDLPRTWLVSTAVALMHTAAEECTAGRLDPDRAATVVDATLLAALTPPGTAVPTTAAGSGSRRPPPE